MALFDPRKMASGAELRDVGLEARASSVGCLARQRGARSTASAAAVLRRATGAERLLGDDLDPADLCSGEATAKSRRMQG